MHGGHGQLIGGYACVGGPSVYYGCVAFRFRERDFVGDRRRGRRFGRGVAVRLRRARAVLRRGRAAARDRGRRHRRSDRAAARDAVPVRARRRWRRSASASSRPRSALGLSPFHLPLAINHARRAVRRCRTCDTYACAIEAKNDVATMMIRAADRARPDARGPARSRCGSSRGTASPAASSVVRTRRPASARRSAARHVIVAAGALGTRAPGARVAARRAVAGARRGRPLPDAPRQRDGVRRSSATRPDREQRFHKQIAIHDWYFGDPAQRRRRRADQARRRAADDDAADASWCARTCRAPLRRARRAHRAAHRPPVHRRGSAAAPRTAARSTGRCAIATACRSW